MRWPFNLIASSSRTPLRTSAAAATAHHLHLTSHATRRLCTLPFARLPPFARSPFACSLFAARRVDGCLAVLGDGDDGAELHHVGASTRAQAASQQACTRAQGRAQHATSARERALHAKCTVPCKNALQATKILSWVRGLKPAISCIGPHRTSQAWLVRCDRNKAAAAKTKEFRGLSPTKS